MSQQLRASDELRLPLGVVIASRDGSEWVFVGWAVTTAGKSAFFVRSQEGARLVPGALQTYTASGLDTLLKKFPRLIEYSRR